MKKNLFLATILYCHAWDLEKVRLAFDHHGNAIFSFLPTVPWCIWLGEKFNRTRSLLKKKIAYSIVYMQWTWKKSIDTGPLPKKMIIYLVNILPHIILLCMENMMVHYVVANLCDIVPVWFIILPFVWEKADIPIIKKTLWAEKKLAPKKWHQL